MKKKVFGGSGLGLRRENIDALVEQLPKTIDFLEFAPENWINVIGSRQKKLNTLGNYYPLVCHGLSLSIGGPAPIDFNHLEQLKTFFDKNHVAYYSEHLSFCSDEKGHLYDLLPMPFTEEAATYIAERIRIVQDYLERKIAIENVSYYCTTSLELSEIEFINAILSQVDCDILLDVNNVYVNSKNHKYDPIDFLNAIPKGRIGYMHIAGHKVESEELIIDTHGDEVTDPVWELLEYAYNRFGIQPTLLERDSNLPPLDIQLKEIDQIRSYQKVGVLA